MFFTSAYDYDIKPGLCLICVVASLYCNYRCNARNDGGISVPPCFPSFESRKERQWVGVGGDYLHTVIKSISNSPLIFLAIALVKNKHVKNDSWIIMLSEITFSLYSKFSCELLFLEENTLINNLIYDTFTNTGNIFTLTGGKNML